MPLLNLPNELLLLVAKRLTTTKDVNTLIRTNRRLWLLLTSRLNALALEGKDGRTPLHWAVVKHHESLVLLLLRLGVTVDVREDAESGAPIHWGAKHGHEKMVRLLLSNGADVAACNNFGETPLHWAAAFGKLQIVRLLLEGARMDGYVDMKDRHGGTALDWAARYGYLEVCKCLLECGADPSVKDVFGQTAGWSAEASGHEEVAKLLREAEIERDCCLRGNDTREC